MRAPALCAFMETHADGDSTDPSSFTRMFKNADGMSPHEWRYQATTRRSEPTGEFINQ